MIRYFSRCIVQTRLLWVSTLHFVFKKWRAFFFFLSLRALTGKEQYKFHHVIWNVYIRSQGLVFGTVLWAFWVLETSMIVEFTHVDEIVVGAWLQLITILTDTQLSLHWYTPWAKGIGFQVVFYACTCNCNRLISSFLRVPRLEVCMFC